MKTRTVIICGVFLGIIVAICLYILNLTKEAERLTMTAPERGWELIEDNGCTSCHQPGSGFRAPQLSGLYGSKVTLASGEEVTADEVYIRRAILEPTAEISAGYQGVMPSYKGLLTDDEIQLIVEALKSDPAAPKSAP